MAEPATSGYDPAVFDAAYRLIDLYEEELDAMQARVGRRMGATLARLNAEQRAAVAAQVANITGTPWFNARLRPFGPTIIHIAERFAWRRR